MLDTGDPKPEFAGVLVAVPTYNEAQNAPRLVTELLRHLPGATILVIDDASPDRTAELVSAAHPTDDLVQVVRRPRKLGLGTAYLHAFDEGRSRGSRIVMTMDADFSHRPEDAPAIIRAVADDQADLAVGSRYVDGGRIVGWPLRRQLLSAAANRLVRISLSCSVTDCTGSFRAYRVELADRLRETGLRNTGYSSLPELLMLAIQNRARIVEVPIVFVERERGATKLTRREVVNSLLSLARLRRERRSRSRTPAPSREVPGPTSPGRRRSSPRG